MVKKYFSLLVIIFSIWIFFNVIERLFFSFWNLYKFYFKWDSPIDLRIDTAILFFLIMFFLILVKLSSIRLNLINNLFIRYSIFIDFLSLIIVVLMITTNLAIVV